jgi:hypothetical protein
MSERQEPGSWSRRLLWFIGLWLAGVAVLALIGVLLRAVLL